MQDLSYTPTNLYGGAMSVSLPQDFADVSNIRDVPDHQEVYLNVHGLTSVIFDIVEYVTPPKYPANNDREALEYHYEDVVAAGFGRDDRELEETTKVWWTEETVFDKLPGKKAYSTLRTQHPLSRTSNTTTENTTAQPANPTPDFTAILLTLLRLPEQSSDVLITINVPHVPGEYDSSEVDLATGTSGRLIDKAMEMHRLLLWTFRILEWDLFVNEE